MYVYGPLFVFWIRWFDALKGYVSTDGDFQEPWNGIRPITNQVKWVCYWFWIANSEITTLNGNISFEMACNCLHFDARMHEGKGTVNHLWHCWTPKGLLDVGQFLLQILILLPYNCFFGNLCIVVWEDYSIVRFSFMNMTVGELVSVNHLSSLN
jgi:hypothetical protein